MVHSLGSPRASLAQELADQIAAMTATAEPDTHLGTKAQLRAQWGVAAATLNEALRLLQARGVVRLRTGPSGGVFVATPEPLVRIGQALVSAHGNPTSIVDAVALRDALDPLTVLEASRYRTTNDIRTLREQLDRMNEAIPDDTAFALEIWEFHRMIVRIGRNEMLREISLGLLEILASNTQIVVPGSKTPEMKLRRVLVHEQLVDAIESGDPARCSAASRNHTLDVGSSSHAGGFDTPSRTNSASTGAV